VVGFRVSKKRTRGENRRCGNSPGRDVAVFQLPFAGSDTADCGCDLCRRVVAAGWGRAAAGCGHVLAASS